MTESFVLCGRVTPGQGKGAGFTTLPWVRAALVAAFGIDPFAGTLNLRLASVADLWEWARLRREAGQPLPAPDPGYCSARCYPVRLADRVTAVVVLPEVPGYPPDQLELVAAVNLRQILGLEDEMMVAVEFQAPPQLSAMVFDVDGTLVDSVEGYRLAAARAAGPYGYEVTAEAVRAALNSNTPFWEFVIADEAERTPELVASLRDSTRRHWPDVVSRHVNCFPDVVTTLDALRARGIRLGIYTGSRGESFLALRRLGLMDHFDVVVTAAEVAQGKPHPEGILRCLERLDVEPGLAAYVGDTVLDMEAGRGAGVLTIGVLSGAATSAELTTAGADWLLPGLAALPGLLRVPAGDVASRG